MGRRDTLLLSMLTLVTTLGWISFDVYHSYIDSTITVQEAVQIVPITPTFERATIDRVKKRQDIEPLTSNLEKIATGSGEKQIATQSGGR